LWDEVPDFYQQFLHKDVLVFTTRRR
jgi:hypothetical protein